ncbi:MAG: transporter substrate-binding domain-containing protein [Myxococcota bacterium]|nr:transporter substrate-binding domain-containing protein [Myxococcota bacterium]
MGGPDRLRHVACLLALLGLLFPTGASGQGDVEATLDEDISFGLPATEIALGDLPEMVERGRVRVLVPYDKTSFFIVNGRARGLEAFLMRSFEDALNEGRDRRERPISVVFKPTARRRLLTALQEGHGDVVAAGLTITPGRQERVAFTHPYVTDVDEVLVSRKDRPPAGSPEGLAGRDIYVAPESSYQEHATGIAQAIAARGGTPFRLVEAQEPLETEDLLQMVNGGLIEFTVADRHVAEIWARALPNIRIESNLVANEGGEIAWAVRKDSPLLLERLNQHVDRLQADYQAVLQREFARYFRNARWVKSEHPVLLSEDVLEMTGYFQTYSDRYAMDWLLMLAQGYQESRLNPSAVSPVGAIGVMQLLPTTAAEMGFPDVTPPEPNIHAGIKYMDWIRANYFKDPELLPEERVYFALAAYNAGPNRMRRLRRKAPEMGLDANRWFGHMEVVTLAYVGMEPVLYVSNIHKYHASYSTPLVKRFDRRTRRDQVVTIQRRLEELGYAAGGVDGIMGRNTRRAIREYQEAHDLAVDGEPSLALLWHLEHAEPKPRPGAGVAGGS